MPEDSFHVDLIDGVPVIAAPEEIDLTNAEALRSALQQAAVDGCGILVLDMTRTLFCDSSGLHTLVAAHKRAQAEGRQLVLVMSGGTVPRVFTLTGIDRVIPHAATVAEALTYTGRNATSTATSP